MTAPKKPLAGVTLGLLTVDEGNGAGGDVCRFLRQSGANVVVCRIAGFLHSPETENLVHRLLTGRMDLVVFLTLAGTRRIIQRASRVAGPTRLAHSLSDIVTLAGSPKIADYLRQIDIEPTIVVPGAGTWRNALTALDTFYGDPASGAAPGNSGLTNVQVAVEQTQAIHSLVAGLEARGSRVTPVPVFGSTPKNARTSSGHTELEVFFASVENDDLQGIVFADPEVVVEFFAQARRLRSHPWRDQVLSDKLLVAIGQDTDEILGDHELGGDVVIELEQTVDSPADVARELAIACRRKRGE